MKKLEIKQIIREEIKSVMNEDNFSFVNPDEVGKAIDGLNSILDKIKQQHIKGTKPLTAKRVAKLRAISTILKSLDI